MCADRDQVVSLLSHSAHDLFHRLTVSEFGSRVHADRRKRWQIRFWSVTSLPFCKKSPTAMARLEHWLWPAAAMAKTSCNSRNRSRAVRADRLARRGAMSPPPVCTRPPSAANSTPKGRCWRGVWEPFPIRARAANMRRAVDSHTWVCGVAAADPCWTFATPLVDAGRAVRRAGERWRTFWGRSRRKPSRSLPSHRGGPPRKSKPPMTSTTTTPHGGNFYIAP